MKRGLVVLAALLAVAAVASADTTGGRTVIATWNPVGAAGRTLKIRPLGRGDCGRVSHRIGEVGYRCGVERGIVDPCWRDGPAPTNLVVCVFSPWAKTAHTIRVPHFMLSPGVTFAAPLDPGDDHPWALELADGKRCVLSGGARDTVPTKNGRLTTNYSCGRTSIYLLSNLVRGRVWRIGAARWTGRRYELLGKVAIRRAIFPSLPPEMQRQNDLAREAAADSGLSHVLRVRMRFPELDWAHVHALAPEGSKAITVWRVVHRQGRRWEVVRVRRPVCRDSRLPASARRQLFGC